MDYAAGYKSKTIQIEANSLYEAKQKAVALLKPTKKDAGQLWVLPVQKVETAGAVALVIDPGLIN